MEGQLFARVTPRLAGNQRETTMSPSATSVRGGVRRASVTRSTPAAKWSDNIRLAGIIARVKADALGNATDRSRRFPPGSPGSKRENDFIIRGAIAREPSIDW
jgi:hypothetical protein